MLMDLESTRTLIGGEVVLELPMVESEILLVSCTGVATASAKIISLSGSIPIHKVGLFFTPSFARRAQWLCNRSGLPGISKLDTQSNGAMNVSCST